KVEDLSRRFPRSLIQNARCPLSLSLTKRVSDASSRKPQAGCIFNILDKFNPGARQLINAGKAYLKALHAQKCAGDVECGQEGDSDPGGGGSCTEKGAGVGANVRYGVDNDERGY
ncbi:hypothetical protein ALC56_08211, partial [Trachymyrmex septentrionalis]